MKFSYNWLQNHFEEKLPSPEELAVKVGLHSFELEGIEDFQSNEYKDTLIDWDVLPNRSSDCLSYMGIAKEIGAVLDIESKIFPTDGPFDTVYSQDIQTSDFLTLEVEDKNLVKRAMKRMAVDVKVGESPEWLKNLLASMGQKSINNVVDITNYVMWTTGQPVHAFDYDKLAGDDGNKKINIGFSQEGEKISDLAGIEHELNQTVLVISDGEKPLDIAGIKGGNNSGVDENTKRLMLSAVNFEYENIRNTSKKLKLQTDASKRFENEVPLRKVALAMGHMSYLLQELAGATISDEIVDTNPDYLDERKISCSVAKINSLLGLEIGYKEVSHILRRLGMWGGNDIVEDTFVVDVPEDRLDLNIWQDVAEEVGRIYGYENIEEVFPQEGFSIPERNFIKESIDRASDVLVEQGFYEVYNRTIVKDGAVKLKNSLNSNATALRINLLDKLEERAQKNLIYADEPKLFEIGKVFRSEKSDDENKVVDEYFSFAGVIGKRKIKQKQKADIFYQTKGYLESIFESLHIQNISWKNSEENDFEADIFNEEEELVGRVGVNFWEIDFEKLLASSKKEVSYKKPSKYPMIKRDIAFWVPLEHTVLEAKIMIQDKLPTEAISLELFDIFENKETNKKSFAFNIIFQAEDRTLDDGYVNTIMDKVYKEVSDSGFEIR